MCSLPSETSSSRPLPLPWKHNLTAAPWPEKLLPRPPQHRPLTAALEEVAVDVLYGGVDGRPSGDTSRRDVRVILGIYVLKSFPWNSRMKFWKVSSKMKIKT